MFDISKVKTPCYVVDEAKLLKNLTILDNVMEKTGCKILLAQKAFSMFRVYPLIGSHISYDITALERHYRKRSL